MMELGSKELIKELAKTMPDKNGAPPEDAHELHHQAPSRQWAEPSAAAKNKMSQTRRIPGHFVLSSYSNGAPEEGIYSNLRTIPDTTEQMEFNISSATQVGHQLALIGDEFNRTYHRKLEDTLLHLAHGVAISVFRTWNIIKSVIRSFGNILNNNWTKRIIGYGSWICRLPFSIFLIDHAWTYRVEHARQQLLHVPGLLHRMTNLMGIDFHGEIPDEGSIEQVLREMWKYNQTYQLSQGTAEEKVPVWYIMDEFGSRIQHSDQPSFATAPLFYMPQQIAYTVLWPLRDLETGDEVTRDYAYGETDRLIRKCVLLPWVPTEVLDVNCFTPEPSDEHYQAILAENKEKLPIAINPPVYDKDKVFKVFTDIQQVLNNLTHPRFVFTDNEGKADILYNFSHFKDYRKLSEERPEVMLNQFPCENLLTVKDCLASISRRAGGPDGPRWLPRTFNLQTELPQFISYFQQRDRRGEDNHWICKPWNLARSLDTHITNSLNNIIRHRESSPKVVCKYIENPVLFHREDVGMVKFDIRYVVLLRSVKPLKLYIYDVFWLRFSNRAFSLDDLDDYEKHFTVMNYAPGVTLKQVHCEEFIPLFEKQYPEYPWATVQANIFKAFAELFQVASAKPAPLGICDYPSSRAIYAVDLMLKWDTSRDGKKIMQPQILEVNFNPDCDRACKYHPTFFNDVFSTLFLDETDSCHVTCIV